MGKRAFVSKLLQDIRASYWFLPSSLVICAVLLSQGTLYIDRHPDLLPFDLPNSLSDTQVDGARSLMAIISQSVFGVAGVMFSMTVVAVSFASGNFGPRLIGNFMRDRGNQWSLGILVATFAYALMITRTIQGPTGNGTDLSTILFVPHLSISIALVLTFVSVLTVIYFVHHIPETINVSNITADLGQRLVTAIKVLIETQSMPVDTPRTIPDTDPDAQIALSQAGYIQTLNLKQLCKLADEHDLLIDASHPVGTFVTPDSVILRVWGGDVSDELTAKLQDCFAVGKTPTENQNLLFIVDLLVEMIARALSPGLNDPFTAINCLNWLQVAAVVAANHKGGLRLVEQGAVHTKSVEFDDLLDRGFGRANHYVVSDPLCRDHMQTLLSNLQDQIETPEHRKSLKSFAEQWKKQESA